MGSNKYEDLALQYAEKYGIISYKVKGKFMIYNQNYYNGEYLGKWVRKPCTYQRKVNLETGETVTKKLGRLVKDGWNNV